MSVYHGWTETDEARKWRMAKRDLAHAEIFYGAGWESDADALRKLLESVEQPHPVETAYELERAMEQDAREWRETYESLRPGLW